MLMGMFFESVGNRHKAMKQYRKALKINPDFGPAANNLAWLYVEIKKDPEKALLLAEKGREQFPGNPLVTDTLGWVYEKKGFHQKAANLFQEAIAQLPNHPTLHFHLGVSLYSLGEKEKAKAGLEEALRLNPRFQEAEEAKKLLKEMASAEK